MNHLRPCDLPRCSCYIAPALLYGTDRTHSAALLPASSRTCIASPRASLTAESVSATFAVDQRQASTRSFSRLLPPSLTFDMSGGTKPEALGRPLDGWVRPRYQLAKPPPLAASSSLACYQL